MVFHRSNLSIKEYARIIQELIEPFIAHILEIDTRIPNLTLEIILAHLSLTLFW